MVNVIIPIVNKNVKFNSIITKLIDEPEINILVGINEDIYQSVVGDVGFGENIQYIKFKSGSKREAVINSLQKYIGAGSVLIMRKPITLDEFNKFVVSKKDVVTCRRDGNKLQYFMFKVWQKLLKFFLGLTEYKGDPSVIYLGDEISAVMSASGNLSFSSRVNRWKGIEQCTVPMSSGKVRSEYDRKDIFLYSIVSILAVVIGVVVTTCVSVFTNVTVMIGLLLVCLDVICAAVGLIMFIILLFNLSVGKKVVKDAVEIIEYKNDDEYEEDDTDVDENDEDQNLTDETEEELSVSKGKVLIEASNAEED